LSLEDGDILRFVLNAHNTANGAPIINVFWYEVAELTGVISTPADLRAVALDVFGTLYPPLIDIQAVGTVYDNIVMDNMTNLIDTASYAPPTPVTGSIAGPAEVTQVALSFKLVRTNRLTRNGSKRIGGIHEAVIEDTTGATFAAGATCTAIETILRDPIEVAAPVDGDCLLYPVIVRRPPVGSPVTVFQRVSDAVFRGAGSQNTRKRLL